MSDKQQETTMHLFATIGARTARGGRVTRVTSKAEYRGLALARVGDIVTYNDGSNATIIDDAGFAASWDARPFALVGSHLSNGDWITETMQDSFGITVRSNQPVQGLFDPAYVPPSSESTC